MKVKHSPRRESPGRIPPESGDRIARDGAQEAKIAAAPYGEEQIAALAYGFWLERGCPEGCPEDDWFRAERELAEAARKR